MSDLFTPTSPSEVADAVAWALERGRALEVVGRGSKRALGRSIEADATLDLSGLTGVTLYEPEELVISLSPGTPRAEVEALLSENGQMLAFEPPDFGPLLGGSADSDSIGGAIAVNASGPRRLKAGAARDFMLGVKAVSGFSEAFKSGGRVVKNVSGYDLSKLVTGSFGTLAAITELTLKVLPRPETTLTLVASGLDVASGTAALRMAAAHPAEASGFAFLPAAVAARAPGLSADASATLVRLEGAAASLPARADALAAEIAGAPVKRIDAEASGALWRAVREIAPLGPPEDVPLWRLSVPPSDAPAVLAANPSDFVVLDWAGGLVWIASAAPPAIARGTAMLARADAETRARLDFLTPPPDALAALVRRVKASFDPKGVLNPGRMYEGV